MAASRRDYSTLLLLCPATAALPKTARKLRIMALRAHLGQPLCQPSDAEMPPGWRIKSRHAGGKIFAVALFDDRGELVEMLLPREGRTRSAAEKARAAAPAAKAADARRKRAERARRREQSELRRGEKKTHTLHGV